MRSRGVKYREHKKAVEDEGATRYGESTSRGVKHYTLGEELNQLKLVQNDDKDWYSSWIKFCTLKTSNNNDTFSNQMPYFLERLEEHESKEYFAQTNFFFTFDFPDDKILHGLSIASVVARKTDVLLNLHVDTVCCSDISWIENIRFIALRCIFPTVFLSCYFDNDHVPHKISGRKCDDNSYVVLLPLFPSQMHMTYELLTKQ
jgi:hypothetical protein